MTELGAEEPCVDIAMATYRGACYLPEQLASIRAQSWPNTRLFVSDDASPDETVAVVLAEQAGITTHVLADRSRKGVVRNFAAALDACTAKYVALSDQDDVWHPEKLRLLMTAMLDFERRYGRSTPILMFSDIEIVDADLKTLHASFFRSTLKSAEAHRFRDFAISNHVPGCAMLFNRALLDRALPVPDVSIHDHWLIQVAALLGRVGYVDSALLKYRQHGGNAIGLGLRERQRPAAYATEIVSRLIQRPRRWRRQAAEIRRNAAVLLDRFRNDDLHPEDLLLLKALAQGNAAKARRVLRNAVLGERRLDVAGILRRLRAA